MPMNGLPCTLLSKNRVRHADRGQRVGFGRLVHPIHEVGTHTGVAHQFPADHVLVAAVLRVGEEPVQGFIQQMGEEHLARYALGLDLAGFELLQGRVLLFGRQLTEAFAGKCLLAPSIQSGDAHTQDVAWGQLALVAELRGRFVVGPLEEPDIPGGVAALHVAIDELGNAGLNGTGAQVIAGDQAGAGRIDESPFDLVEEHGRIGCSRRVLS